MKNVAKPSHLCPRCGRPNYYKGAVRPFCSESCAIAASRPS